MFKRLILSIFLLFLGTSQGLFAQIHVNQARERLILEHSRFIENYEIRQNLRALIANKQFSSIDMSARIYTQEAFPNRVRVSILRTEESFFIVFANELLQSLSAPQTEASNSYDIMLSDRFKLDGRGSYIIKKNILSGEFEQIKIYLQSGSESYIVISPIGSNEAIVDVYLMDIAIYRNVRLPMSFMSIATTSLAQIMASTAHTIDWNLIFPSTYHHHARWDSIAMMARQINLRLPTLHYVEDGAQNAQGALVYARTQELQKSSAGLGTAGFVKWLIDGIYMPLQSGNLISIDTLKTVTRRQRTNSALAIDEETLEHPFFYLDWNRNLAYAVSRAIFPRHRIHLSDSDVTDTPFIAYTPDIGYPINATEAVLYLESIRFPGSIYLGSLNMLTQTTPAVRRHMIPALFIPYFDTLGNFHVDIFANNQRMSIETLGEQYPGSFIHLQRINTNDTPFNLPLLQPNKIQ
ncbi:hypothetical protein PVA45_00030 [Entomospira entomophila]|uniref:Uncharacterized protein n=1 Tax=Entomospira entomophila TaxID=2719988 RepID=A0A968GAN9_9SPIO|nr:hypothetical protein [Entomospira entomophilus]NIZ39911.1 hypothetical protein [Entomospira entomophilus]WDI35473.1 hypothetical protein PVA45_00030 [Entomospira entomophilus]